MNPKILRIAAEAESNAALRRNGDIERAVDIATYAFIGGFNDTSNMEAAHRLDIPAVGTIAHYWQQWSDPRLIVAVLHNNDLNQVTWEMRSMEGSPKFVESQQLPDVDAPGGLEAVLDWS